MMKLVMRGSAFVVALLMVLAGASGMLVAGDDGDEKVGVIVTFKDKVDEKLITGKGGAIDHRYKVIPAVATKLSTITPANALRERGMSLNIEGMPP